MVEKDHEYSVDTKISTSLGIGLANCRHDEKFPLGDFIDVDQAKLDSMSEEEVDKEIQEATSEWAYQYIDFGWSADKS